MENKYKKYFFINFIYFGINLARLNREKGNK